jgi:hypothetical protein
MPRYSVTGPLGPEEIDYGTVLADSPFEALRKSPCRRPRPRRCAAAQRAARIRGVRHSEHLCWRVTEFRRNGNVPYTIEVALSVAAAA